MLHILALLTLLLTAADHWTTYLCLKSPVPGFDVSEANPVAGWLFQSLGLLPGILLDSVVTVAAIGFLVSTALIPRAAKRVFLMVVIGGTGYAVVNNLQAMIVMGLSPLGSA